MISCRARDVLKAGRRAVYEVGAISAAFCRSAVGGLAPVRLAMFD